MKRIQVLPDYVAHKIAAGEVIERPVSVVKELVENSIDALATSIEIEVRDGGKEYIRVSDNGSGIHPDDLQLAFVPHATSKIRTVDDLFAITSLGFRGEALASIAAVSELVLRSRIAESDQGYQITFNQEHQGMIEPVGMDFGTTVEIRRLFYNTPARFKFLKQSITERRYIVEFVSNIALAHPHIAFKLIADDKLLVRTHGQGELKTTLASLTDHYSVKNMIAVDYRAEWGAITGYIGKPNLTRKSRQGQLIIINGRIIDSALITSAVERAYQGMIGNKLYPVFVILLTINPALIDVNVHPAKSQVRFQDEQALFHEVSAAIKHALLQTDLSVPINVQERKAISIPNMQTSLNLEVQQLFPWQPLTWSKVDEFLVKEQKLANAEPILVQNVESEKQLVQEQKLSQVEMSIKSTPAADTDSVRHELRNGRIIGQFRQTYILLETSSGLWMLDQHIVHERILYERFLKKDYQPNVQQVLPQALDLSSTMSDLIAEQYDKLTNLGFDLEEFGANCWLLRGIPQELAQKGITVDASLITELVSDLARDHNWREQAATTLACKGAIKAGQSLTNEQIQILLNQLAAVENPFTCPHGRPIIVKLEDKEILRRFGR